MERLPSYLPHAFAVSDDDVFCYWCEYSEKVPWHVPDIDRYCVICGAKEGELIIYASGLKRPRVLQPFMAWRRCDVCARHDKPKEG